MSSYNLLTVSTSGKEKRQASSGLTIDFSSVRIGSDVLSIAQGGSGAGAYLDIGARALRSSYVASDNADLVNFLALNNAIAALQAGVSWQDAVSTRASTPAGGESTGTRILITSAGSNAITAVDQGNKTFTVAGDQTANYAANDIIKIKDSTGNNGYYTVVSDTFDTDHTDIVVVEAVPSATADGSIYYAGATFSALGVDKIATKGAVSWTAGSAPTAGWAALVNDDTGKMYIYGTSSWAPSYFEATTASNGIKKSGFDIQRDDTVSKTNDNGSAITVRKVVYVKSNGNVDLALATNSALAASDLGLVYDTSISSGAPGAITVRQGALVSGFTGLTPGAEYYVDNSTAGLINLYSAITWAAGDQVVRVGRALSATELLFDPEFYFEY